MKKYFICLLSFLLILFLSSCALLGFKDPNAVSTDKAPVSSSQSEENTEEKKKEDMKTAKEAYDIIIMDDDIAGDSQKLSSVEGYYNPVVESMGITNVIVTEWDGKIMYISFVCPNNFTCRYTFDTGIWETVE